MKNLFLSLILVLSSIISVAQVGWTCDNPYVIDSLPFDTADVNTINQPNYYSADDCGSPAMDGKEYIFSYTPEQDMFVDINISGAAQGGVGLFVFTDCPDVAGSCYEYEEGGLGSLISGPNLTNIYLQAGQQYFIIGSTDPGLGGGLGSDHVIFDIEIIPHIYDVGVCEIVTPNSACGLTENEIVTVKIANYGTEEVNDIPVYYYINGNTETALYEDNILPGDTVEYSFIVPIDLSASSTYDLEAGTNYDLDVDNSNDNTVKQIVSTPGYSLFPYIEDFDGATNDFVITGTNSSWEKGIPASNMTIDHAMGGDECLVTNLSGYSNNDEVSYIESACFDLTTSVNPILRFGIWYETGDSALAQFEYSIDDGQTWDLLESNGNAQGWFNQDEGWQGNSGKWVGVEYPLADFMQYNNIRFRFVFYGGNEDNEGIAIDEFEIDDCNVFPTAMYSYTVSGMTVNFTNNSFNANNYMWSFGDGSTVSFDENPSHTYDNPGQYEVKMVAYTQCGTDTVMYTIDIVTGIEVMTNENIKIFPNPSTGENLNIIGITETLDFAIIDITGKEIQRGILKTEDTRIKLTDVEKGIYLIKLFTENKTFHKSIIVE